jgi:hypothetical protein
MGNSNRDGRGLVCKRNKYVNPPKDSTWVFETREMLESPAYRARSINARRLWDAIKLEHLINGAFMNGELVMPYNELQRIHGCSRCLIRDAIDELVALGFLAEGEPRPVNGNHRPANTYRLTFLGTGTGAPPTNEWKKFKDAKSDFIALVKRAAKEERQEARQLQRAQRQKHRAQDADFRSPASPTVESPSKVVSLASSPRGGSPR